MHPSRFRDYLLGRLTEAERLEIESLVFEDDDFEDDERPRRRRDDDDDRPRRRRRDS